MCYNFASASLFWFFGCEACGILTPQARMEPVPSALEGQVSTTAPPRERLGKASCS